LRSQYQTWFFLLIILIFSFLFYYPAHGAWYYDYTDPNASYYNSYRDMNPRAYYRVYKYPKDKKKDNKKKEKISKEQYVINKKVAQEQAKIYAGIKPAMVETTPTQQVNVDEYSYDIVVPVLPKYPLDHPYRPFYWGKQRTLLDRLNAN